MNLQTHYMNQPLELRSLIQEDGSIWFVAKDVCEALGIEWKGNDSIGYLDEDESAKTGLIDALGREQEAITISEAGLYRLIFRSNKPNAKKFTRWVTHEVLPRIRQTGSYAPAGPTARQHQDLIKQIQARIKHGDMKQMAEGIGVSYRVVLRYVGFGTDRMIMKPKRETLQRMVAWLDSRSTSNNQLSINI